MGSARPRNYLISSVIDHCLAFNDHLEPLKYRQYASDFPLNLLINLSELNAAIKGKLDLLQSDPDFQFLSDEEAEEQILRYSTLYSYLYFAASFVDRSDDLHSVVELGRPIKRLMRQQCQLIDFEILLHPLPLLNYTFLPLGTGLSTVANQLGFAISLPRQLVTIGFPGLEKGQILIHSLIAHELGHCLYIQMGIEQKLLPRVKPDEKALDELAKQWAETKIDIGAKQSSSGQRTLSDYVSEVELRSSITKQTNSIAKLWVKELACDALGYSLFGPAYLFAVLDFLTLTLRFDDDKGTHPSNRMRFILLYKMLDNDIEFIKILDQRILGILDSWRKVTNDKSPQYSNPINKLAGDAILAIYPEIIREAIAALGTQGLYSASQNVGEINNLVSRTMRLIPPNELIINGVAEASVFQSILNAGWLVYLSGLEDLREVLQIEYWDSKARFNELIARAIELNEVQKRWKEVQ